MALCACRSHLESCLEVTALQEQTDHALSLKLTDHGNKSLWNRLPVQKNTPKTPEDLVCSSWALFRVGRIGYAAVIFGSLALAWLLWNRTCEMCTGTAPLSVDEYCQYGYLYRYCIGTRRPRGLLKHGGLVGGI